MKERVYNHFDKEMQENPSLYLSSTGDVNLTALSESFINENELSEQEEDEVYYMAVYWLDIQVSKGNIDPVTNKWRK